MTDKHTFFVCQFCAGSWQDGNQVGNSGGYLLRQDLKTRIPHY
jgi:predicted metal-binding protein